MPLSEQLLARAKAIPGGENLKAEATHEELIALAEGRHKEAAKVADLVRERDALKAAGTSADAKQPALPTAREMYLSAKDAKQAREKAVAAKAISTANADKLEASLVGSDYRAIALNRTPQAGDDRLIASLDTLVAAFEALEGNVAAPPEGVDARWGVAARVGAAGEPTEEQMVKEGQERAKRMNGQ